MRHSVRWQQFSSILLQALMVLAGGIFLFLIFWLLSILFTQIAYSNSVFPGIHVDGVDLGGMSIQEAAVALQNNMNYMADFPITLIYQDQSFTVGALDLGIRFDLVDSTQRAYSVGRTGSPGHFFAYHLFGRFAKQTLPPVFEFDHSAAINFLADIKPQIDQPVRDSTLQIQGTEVIALDAQIGKSLDLAASVESIEFHLRKGKFSPIPLVVNQMEPSLQDAGRFAETAKVVLGRPFEFQMPADIESGKVYSINQSSLAAMLTFISQTDEDGVKLLPRFQEDLLTSLLADIAAEINLSPQNPRFIFNDETRELDLMESGRMGRELDIQASFEDAQEAIQSSDSSATLVVNSIQPEVDDGATARELGITELVHAESSYFFGSSADRIQNIERASAEFHGLLIPPGVTFSMADQMKEISLDNGYTEALIIYNGQTIEGVGGGVCQVSTTLFRTAFFAGFPIVERHPHAYRVSYYEKTAGNNRDSNLAGLDATVYVPIVDLKFSNDTEYWLLMETYINRSGSRILWKFYSTSDARTVEWQTTGPVNIVKPKKPFYKLNTDLEAGEIKQVDWEAEGADVRVDRSVFREGDLFFSDSFFTQYAPWRAVYEYGPGTEGIPENADSE